jgi:sialic acid synthase SpsE
MIQAPWKKKNAPYIIAEIGSNHDGDKNRALDLIALAATTGADAVKFQLFKAETLVLPSHPSYATLQKVATPREWLPDLADAAQKVGVDFSATPFDMAGIKQLAAVNPAFIKIASSDMTFFRLLQQIAHTGLPIIMSSGMADFADTERALSEIRKHGANEIGLMHCVSMYPPAFTDMNLRVVAELASRFGLASGLSDHTQGSCMTVAACALGGTIFEKHITDDRSRAGADHSYALEIAEFKTFVADVHNTFIAIGDGNKEAKGAEPTIKIKARRGLYSSRDILPGETLTGDNIIELRPTNEINAEEIDVVLGTTTHEAIAAFSPLPRTLLNNGTAQCAKLP